MNLTRKILLAAGQCLILPSTVRALPAHPFVKAPKHPFAHPFYRRLSLLPGAFLSRRKREISTIMQHTLKFLLVVGLCTTSAANSFAQTVAPGTAVVPEGIQTTIDNAKALRGKGRFAEAQTLLETRLKQNPPETEQMALQNALADVHYYWAKELSGNKAFEQALPHCQAAYENDVKWRPAMRGRDLRAWAGCNSNLKRYEEALKYWRMAATALHENKEFATEAHVLINVAFACQKLERPSEALTTYYELLRLQQERKDSKGEVRAWQKIADTHLQLKHEDQANAVIDEAIAIFQKSENRAAEAELMRGREQFAEAQTLLETRLKQNPPETEQMALQNALADVHYFWGNSLSYAKDFEEALPHYQIAYEIDERWRPAMTGRELGFRAGCNFNLKRYEEALKYWRLSAAAWHKNKKLASEAHVLMNVALACRVLRRLPEALTAYEEALSLRRKLKDSKREVSVQQMMAQVHVQLKHFGQAITILHSLGDRTGEVGAIEAAARDCEREERRDDALRFYNQALPIYHELKKDERECEVLGKVGSIYLSQGRYAESLRALGSELTIAEASKLLSFQAQALNLTGSNYMTVQRYPDALSCFDKALIIYRQLNAKNSEAEVLFNTGACHSGQRQPEKALEYYNSALSIYEETGNVSGQAIVSRELTEFYRGPGRIEKAIAALNSALEQSRENKNRYDEAIALLKLASTYQVLNRNEEALEFYKSAVSICQRIKRRDVEAGGLYAISLLYNEQNKPEEAILYGKQAVNVYQAIRLDNQNLDKESQRSYLSSIRSKYETVAQFLITQDRLDEAEQVLRFLRQEDAFEFAQGNPSLAQELAQLFAPLSFTKAEIQKLAPEVAASVQESEGIEESQLWKQALQNCEAGGRGRSALLSTFNTSDMFIIIVATAKGRRAFSFPIKREDFDALSQRLQHELSHSDEDPRFDALRMYNIVFCNGQVEQVLQEEGINTALWFASGSLRYIPIDALYDGTQYLVQKSCANVNVTLTSRRWFETPTNTGPMVAAGVSQGHIVAPHIKGPTIQFSPLSNVPNEVRSIVDDTAHGGTGPFAGHILLDKDFTVEALEQALSQHASNLHVATHFDLDGSNDSDSFLLLGDGTAFPISQWKKSLDLNGVGLLTLSACETGVGRPDATGGEVSSIGEISQWLGAQSVIVSLWPVADNSTAELMGDFYKRWSAQPQQGKAVALRDAQRNLLGDDMALPTGLAQRGRPQQQDGNDDSAATFIADTNHPYAHPFYWAPFSLIGNWK